MRQQGYSLLEVLIALLVLSIGLLGLAGLQTASLQSNQSAAQVSQATFLAHDMFDRMRANRDDALDNRYSVAFSNSSDDFSGDSLTDFDRAEWLRQMESVIPGTRETGCGEDGGEQACGASVNVDGNGRAEITIRWVNTRLDEGDDQRLQSFTTVTHL
ncbi:type IV pilus modification protein PilV [Aquisalimonas asiatica]|uniref:Type IV pilus assembly protein PilV n=1 Tax=Aquisalimonas asiatica TaxID=406100 RepID=A0A1H8S3B8_9GAMM|nr:type IV pilus modification protein PilV [Aquisalimonas asiatica]SEO72914.1 type IV pilus assembly protein PilV [Aquisalimonas asiatica]